MTEVVKSAWLILMKTLSDTADVLVKGIKQPGVQLYLFVMLGLLLLSSGDLAKLLQWSAKQMARVLTVIAPRLIAAAKWVRRIARTNKSRP